MISSLGLLQTFAVGLFAFYVAWNAFWLLQLRVPVSLFTAITGLPCPTTGGTRAMLALCDGRVFDSLRYNAFTLPILGLFLGSVCLVVGQFLRGLKLRLPRGLFVAWLAVLGTAWVWKLSTDPLFG